MTLERTNEVHILCIDWKVDGSKLAAGCSDGTRQMDHQPVLDFSQQVRTLNVGRRHSNHPHRVHFDRTNNSNQQPNFVTSLEPECEQLGLFISRSVQLWNFHKTKPVKQFKSNVKGTLLDWHYSTTKYRIKSFIACAGGSDSIFVWDLSVENAEPKILKEHSDCISSIAFAPNGEFLSALDYHGNLFTWSTKAKKPENRVCLGTVMVECWPS